MYNKKRTFVFAMISFLCGLVVVVVSASAMAEAQSKAQLIGLIAGSFGAGAAFVNAIREYTSRRG